MTSSCHQFALSALSTTNFELLFKKPQATTQNIRISCTFVSLDLRFFRTEVL